MKKRLMTVLIAVCTLVFGLAVLAACGGGKLELSQEEVSVGVGDTTNVVAMASDGTEVTWTSSDESIVTITKQDAKRGRATIRGEKSGVATLTATSGKGAKGECKVTVKNYQISLSDSTLIIYRNASDNSYESKTITATVLCDGEQVNEKVNWASSDEQYVTVENGVLTAHRITETPVTITAQRAGGSASATCSVSVMWDNAPAGWYEVPEDGSAYAVANPNKWSWSGFVGTDDIHPEVYGEGFEGGKATFIVSGNTGWRWYGAQIFYKNGGNTAGNVYELTVTIKSTEAGWITINDTDIELTAGEAKDYKIIYREGDTSISMNLATHDKIRNNVNPIGQYKEGTIEILGMKWEPHNATKLSAPTDFTIGADKELTVTDTNKDEEFEGYIVGFFKGDETDPTYAMPVMKPVEGRDILTEKDGRDQVKEVTDAEGNKSLKMYLDDSFVPAGKYTVKVRAYCGTPVLEDSDWSAGKAYTVAAKDALEYKVLQSYRDVDRGIGRYYVWSEWNQYQLEDNDGNPTCYFKGNSLTLTLNGEASWYSNQVFYTSKDITPTERDKDGNLVPRVYEMTFTLSAKTKPDNNGNSKPLDLTGRKFVIEGQILDAVDGGTYTVRFLSSGSITMFLGQPTGESWNETVGEGGLAEGVYTFENIQFKDATDPATHDVWFFGNTVATAKTEEGQDKLMYWYAPVGDWAEWNATIDMRSMTYEANQESGTGYSYHFNYKITPIENKNCPWIFQLWYMKSGLDSSKEYHVELVINATEAGVILVDNQEVQLEVGKKTYKVYLTNVTDPLFISMATNTSMTGTSENGMDLLFESIKWIEGGRQALQAPADGSLDATSGTVTFTDSNEKGTVDHYEIGFFKGSDLISTQQVKSGDKIEESVLVKGDYTVKLRFCGDADHKDTDWVQIGTYTVTKGRDYGIGEAKDAVADKGHWYAWLDQWDWCGSQATAKSATIGTNSLTFTYTSEGNPRLGYSVQLFYKNPENTARLYNVIFKVKLSVDGTITVNDKHIALKANVETPVKIGYNEGGNSASLSIQMGVYGAGAPVMNATLTITELKWEETTAQTLAAPTGLSISDGNVTFTDPNAEGVDFYQLGFYLGDRLTYSYPVEKGGKLVTEYLFKGNYTVKVRAIGYDAAHLDSVWAGDVSYNVTTDPAYNIAKKPEKGGDPYCVFFYWAQWDGIQNGKYENGALSFDITNNGNWDSNQIFYKLGIGGKGTFTFDLESSVSGYKIAINGNIITLKQGKQSLKITDSDLEFSVLMGEPKLPYWDGTVSYVPSGSFTFSNFKWTVGDPEKGPVTVYTLEGLQA